MNIAKEIGVPALLEQCAEECGELSHACLKMARKLRHENPTPMSKQKIFEHLNEETADVQLCIDALFKAGVLTRDVVDSNKIVKAARWEQRMEEFKNEKEN